MIKRRETVTERRRRLEQIYRYVDAETKRKEREREQEEIYRICRDILGAKKKENDE